ncbi:hypothetical protein GALMADRAFT_228808 [Galerina marginata CBS 339.88]|uniref:Uncharacterized protein n=1 Tax=Galerina marginata (strain CBS 339.88) TaxID=685588 RepID=A0A067T0J0_GALM3|nr:hypothetical protein GALMADRAFT_228808 [Galerina marginata CBS 339.88]
MSNIPVINQDGSSFTVSWLIGSFLSGVAYGLELTLAANCFYLLGKSSQNISKRTRRFHFAFIIFNCLLGTAAFAYTMAGVIIATIFSRDALVARVGEYWTSSLTVPFSAVELIPTVLVTWSADGFMLWRCVMLYEGISPLNHIAFMSVVVILTLASLGVGMCGLLTVVPTTPWEQNQMLFRFQTASLIVNGIVSTLIICRITYHRRYLQKIFGKGYGKPYMKIMAICIESAMLALVWDILFIILSQTTARTGVHSAGPEIYPVIKLLIHVNIIYPMLIIFRVAQGKAFPSDPTKLQPPSSADSTGRIGELRFISDEAASTII